LTNEGLAKQKNQYESEDIMMKRGIILFICILFLDAALLDSSRSLSCQGAGTETIERKIFPERSYDPSIPAPSEFFGYEMGAFHTTYTPVVLYFQELAKRSNRIRFNSYGESHEHRSLYYAVISSVKNIERLDEIKRNMSRLADPENLENSGEAERIVETSPAIVFLNFGNDGNETAAFESAFHFAYQLVAAKDKMTEDMLEEVVMIFIPAMNPDSHERFVAWYNATQVGRSGTADPNASEHFAPWGLDTNNNHYQVNLNRESVWNTQVECRALIRLYLEWNPQVFVDHHGQPVGFIGPWYTEPLNVEITPDQRDWLARFGEDMAGIFGDHGFRYTPWEFGVLYPGYWDSFALLNGAIAFTTESGGGGWKGLQLRHRGGHITTLKDGIIQNLIADESVLRTTATLRARKLRDYLAYKRSALDEARSHPVQAYAIPLSNDPQRLESVINLMLRNGIRVYRATEAFDASQAKSYFANKTGSQSLDEGSIVIPMVQPQSRMLRVLMEPDSKIPKVYLDRVEKVRKLSEQPGYLNPNIWVTTEPFYDVTAWSIPFTYDIEAYRLASAPRIELERLDSPFHLGGKLLHADALAYAFGYESNRAIGAIGKLRQWGIKFCVASSDFRVGGRRFGRGAIVVFDHENREVDLPALMNELVNATGIDVLGITSNLLDEGPHLGSDQYLEVVNKRIAIIRGGPVRPSSFGSLWFLFERVYDLAFTALEFDHIERLDLTEYGVLVFPDGFYSGIRPETEKSIARKLRAWVSEGGSLIGIKGASSWMAKEDLGLTTVRTEGPYVGKSIYMTDGGHPPLPVVPSGDRERGSQPEAAPREQLDIQQVPMIPGAILRAKVYPYHYLAYGYTKDVPVLVWSNLVFSADASVGAPVVFDSADRIHVSGFAFRDSLEKLAGTPYLIDEKRGLGHVILYADDPNFRLYWDGLTRLFFNSVLFSNSF
jgi:hypothetical protein